MAVLPRVVAILLEKLCGHVIRDGRVDIVTAEECVTRSRQHLEHVAGELQNRDVEGTAAEVVHGNALG